MHSRKNIFKALYTLAFLLALHSALPAYINSAFITSIISEQFVGTIFTLGSLLAIVTFIQMPRVLTRFGNYKTVLFFTGALIVSVLGLAFLTHPFIALPLFLIYLIASQIIWFTIDLFLEHFTSDAETGTIRGIYFTIINIAWVLAPLLMGILLGDGNRFWLIYLLAGLLLMPLPYILRTSFRSYKDAEYKHTRFWKTFGKIVRNKDIFNVFMIALLLQFFYSWMVIYTPLYLIDTIGFDWNVLGVIFTIMLLPFALFQYPLGKIADLWLGEKELLVGGFLIMALSTAVLSFITTPTIWLWAVLLFVTRVGASAVGIMSDTYFFKKTNDADSDILSFFRMTSPLAYVIGPLIASGILFFTSMQYLFIILGAIMLLGGYYSLKLKDTK